MSILARIRAHGGDAVRDQWRITLKPGRMTAAAIEWVRIHWRDVCCEVWPEFEDWEERAAIMEFDGGLSRAEAEAAAYRRGMA